MMIFAHTEKERMVAAMTNEEAIVQLEIDATNLVGRLASEPVHNTSFSELWKRKLEAIDIAIYAVKMFDKHEAECERCACNSLAERDALKEETLISNADVAEVVHGRWESVCGCIVRCNSCGSEAARKSNYCPNCGARMDAKEDKQ
jgi:hypothetical protein